MWGFNSGLNVNVLLDHYTFLSLVRWFRSGSTRLELKPKKSLYLRVGLRTPVNHKFLKALKKYMIFKLFLSIF